MNTFLKIIYPGIGIVCMVNNTALSLLKQSNDSLTSYKNASFSNNESLFLNNSKYNASNGVETCLFTSQEGGKNGLVLISKHLANKS